MDVTFEEGQPWVILNKIEQQIKEKIEKYGTPLKNWPGIKINYGIKTGCNEAFIIDEEKRKEILANCLTEEEREKTAKLIRPILRGKDIKCGSYNWAGLLKKILLLYIDISSSTRMYLRIEDNVDIYPLGK